MKEFNIWLLFKMTEKFRDFEEYCFDIAKKKGDDFNISELDGKIIIASLEPVINLCEQLEMSGRDEPIYRAKGIQLRIAGYEKDYKGGQSYLAISHDIRALRQSIQLSLMNQKFLSIPSNEADFYSQDDLFGIKDKFPIANEEIKLAGNCYATGNYTACVFHLMRAVEIGAKAMVKALKAQKFIGKYKNVNGAKTFVKKPIELCDWKTLRDGLRNALNTLDTGSSMSVKKKDTLAYYSHAVAQFSNFKDAWRNIISHGHEVAEKRKQYLQGETMDIMNNTKHFMQHLAKRIKE